MAASNKAQKEATQPTGTDVEKRRAVDDLVPEAMQSGSAFDSDILRTLDSFDDAVKLAMQAHGGIAVASEQIGDGFALLNNKDLLVGQQMLLMEWNFYPGDFGRMFVAIRVVARNAMTGGISKYIINDGGTGICDQLARYSKDTGKYGGLAVKNGLRKSEYDTDKDGQPTSDKTLAEGRGVTYYHDTSA